LHDDPILADDDALLTALSEQGPVNLPRAYEVMERFGVDGLVVGDPLNVYHLLGYYPHIALTRWGQPPTTFAILTRDQDRKPAIVTSHFIYYYSFADGGSRGNIPAYLFEASANLGEDLQVAPNPLFFADRQAAPLTAVERRRRTETDRVLATRHLYAEAGGALVGALKDLGLWKGTLAVDHPVVTAVDEQYQRPGRTIPGDNILRWIRVVKSPLELDLMRRGAQANAAAVDAVVASVREGAGYRDLRRLFDVEAAKRGNKSVFMTIDRVSTQLPREDRVCDGQSLFFDGVSHFQHYHGDYARTVFVGEPTQAVRREAEVAVRGWEAIREQLRPGLPFARIAEIGRETLVKTHADSMVTFGPHSVGLMHTDEPGLDLGGFYAKEALTLEENMILSVDCPSLATGIGGSVHIEDLVQITADGAIPIHKIDSHVITV
jgi:Xaa-Pro aminopeptidase